MGSKNESLICLTVAEKTIKSALSRIQQDRQHIDIAEIRTDFLEREELAGLKQLPRLTDVPLLLTVRRTSDGGRWDGPEADRRRILLEAAVSRYHYVDMESDVRFPDVEARCAENGTTIIRSMRDFNGVPERLSHIIKDMPRKPDEIPKVAVTPGSVAELATIVKACRDIPHRKKIVLGMGTWGFPTRVLAGKLGSYLTYCSPAGLETSPEYIDPETLVSTYRFREISKTAAVYCIIANPVMHSRSPWIHNPAFRSAGVDAVYVPVQVDDLSHFFDLAPLLDIRGVSVSVPHKAGVRQFLAAEDNTVAVVGSCNTVVAGEGGYHGANTDVPGFTASLLAAAGGGDRVRGMSATVIGAGGTSRAVTYALKLLGVNTCILNRTAGKAESLAAEFGCAWGPLDAGSLPLIRSHSDLIIQTTSAGMHPQDKLDPLAFYEFSGNEIVYDVIYSPPETILLRRAKEAGCRTQNGQRMLLEQAYLQFKLFSGTDYPKNCRGVAVF